MAGKFPYFLIVWRVMIVSVNFGKLHTISEMLGVYSFAS